MIIPAGRLYVAKSGSGLKKSGTVSFSAARYLSILAGSEKRGSVNAVKRNLSREAQKIKNSGGDPAQINRALQKIKYVMKKADEKMTILVREERNNERIRRTEDAGRKEEAKRLKKINRVQKHFRKSNEHGNIVRAALNEKDELKRDGVPSYSAEPPAEGLTYDAGAAAVSTGTSTIDIKI